MPWKKKWTGRPDPDREVDPTHHVRFPRILFSLILARTRAPEIRLSEKAAPLVLKVERLLRRIHARRHRNRTILRTDPRGGGRHFPLSKTSQFLKTSQQSPPQSVTLAARAKRLKTKRFRANFQKFTDGFGTGWLFLTSSCRPPHHHPGGGGLSNNVIGTWCWWWW